MQAGREIKFRGKCIAAGALNGEWVSGDLIQKNDKMYITPHTNFVTVSGHVGKMIVMHEVSPESVGQFTGHRDKNIVAIYEGDILRYPDAYECGGDWEETLGVGEITWDVNQAQFTVSNRDSVNLECLFDDIEEAEIIGNIYENPELLEVGNDTSGA